MLTEQRLYHITAVPVYSFYAIGDSYHIKSTDVPKMRTRAALTHPHAAVPCAWMNQGTLFIDELDIYLFWW